MAVRGVGTLKSAATTARSFESLSHHRLPFDALVTIPGCRMWASFTINLAEGWPAQRTVHGSPLPLPAAD